ncbi:MAG: DUF2950 family protein [Planctomycetota bacterium]|jgi:hypothetical protein
MECTRCRTVNPGDARFCGRCGLEFAKAPKPPEPPKPSEPAKPRESLTEKARSAYYQYYPVFLLVAGVALAVFLVIIISSEEKPKQDTVESNEAKAVETLRELASVMRRYFEEDLDGDGVRNYWVTNVRGLRTNLDTDGRQLKLIDERTRNADGRMRGRSPSSGYYFAAVERVPGGRQENSGSLGHSVQGFAICAYPSRYGKTGVRTYLIDENGEVYWIIMSGMVTDRHPGDLEANGWTRHTGGYGAPGP